MESDPQQTKSLTWQYTRTSVVKYDLRILYFLGFWPLLQSRVFRALTAAVVMLGVGHFAEAVINLSTLQGDLEDYTLAVSHVATVCVGAAKMIFFVFHEHEFCKLVRWLDALVASQMEHIRGQLQGEAIFYEAQKLGARITLCLLANNVFIVTVWSLAPLMASEGEKRLPFQQLPFAAAYTSPLYELSYALQTVSVFVIGFINVHVDCFFAAVMIHTSAQINVLAFRMTDVYSRNASEKSKQNSDGGKQRHSSASYDNSYKELCLWVQFHQEITRFVKHLESVMSPVATMQFIHGMLSGIMLIFPAASSSENGDLVKCLASAPTVSTPLLLYCLGAHSVREQGESLSLAVYSCHWTEASTSFRRALLIVMSRAQRPYNLTAGGIYPIERSTFLSLLNAGYSYYALLKNFNGR
ncbi:odorant receptor 43a-like [Schistocerca serialis cubense]|uniref:odorant receptor 43a-like n=1 Tax=Schistocerca serialis cubense TaxID=2023355 RepID=UPI00214F2824|nr:odorant receptor 43a-like [Schistocerca serialis cubense]